MRGLAAGPRPVGTYAELVVSDTLWPDFAEADLHDSIRAFAGRNRRFGALDHTNTLRR